MNLRAMPERLRAWLARRPAWFADVLLALFVTVVQVQSVSDYGAVLPEPVARPTSDFGYAGYLLVLLSGLVIVFRRRWPVAVFVVTGVASLVYFGLGFPDRLACLGLFVALYTLAAYGDGRRFLLIAGTGTAVLSVGWLIAGADVQPREAVAWVLLRIGASVISITLGESVRSRRVIAADAQRRAEMAERAREEETRARVDAERLRIAREVHDTVAHAIAIINVQASVTAHVLDKRPAQARDALRAIEQTSSRALHEMRAVLGVLREDDGREPHPGLDQLHALASKAREAGLDVSIEKSSDVAPLPSAVDSAAYRIIQESITNVIRHVGPTRVTVSVEVDSDTLGIRVTDEGTSDPVLVAVGAGPPSSGRGIIGMRERCQLLGGELHATSRPGGGFEVVARLPLAPVAPRP
ncbi:sensor histidine kinase [Micromonospora andamanensis]|uniref:histidine kinase n=1 Tax=Micromonospora andamanensis TaxID=1287068 RepID=A0ABQ4HVY6_9ACTN|nr:sensor histidine kinase [Micromonospora andamanensis]GIJ09829.1 two-component sensor histidine kinase [Micromonospora andamanensis]GIJ38402.1 two-component sensor histidine kinase [Micromonospora andamanensis]